MPEKNRFTGKIEPSIRDYSLADALDLIDQRFGIENLLEDLRAPRDGLISGYYKYSKWGYERYSGGAAMHVALADGDDYKADGLKMQGRTVVQNAQKIGATRVLELGCGQAFNARFVAGRMPSVEVVGLDLMQHHVVSANERGSNLSNFRAVQGSFTDIPKGLGKFDVIFGVETLCYASDASEVVEQVMEHLSPGGVFLIFDVFRKPDFENFSEDLQRAEVINELCMAISDGFFTEGEWEEAMRSAGMVGIRTRDLSHLCMGTCRRLGRVALLYMVQWRYRLMHRFVPKHLSRNAVSGFLGTYAIFGDTTAPDVDKGIVRYNLVRGMKPR
ncbi:class I SAM-dependent methyltransferase [Maritimibacter dapengensis]|uniref:Class I SAM-dependent methyltransferase n=1 Tax=Maritimibacter dapengensis TaxID=2836868 RepID=A0ABS6T619_9RHOB|nr:class I SAM-dependent methyltransferase [Maritimibacter dapengensis]MBV7380678.1 class I SAM-dependent methyltransferase [Maritimibacter dapengensis]